MRIYREHLTQVYTRNNDRSGSCVREACGEHVAAIDESWVVCHNRSDGWVTNSRLVHATCGEQMTYRMGRDYVSAGRIIPVDER